MSVSHRILTLVGKCIKHLDFSSYLDVVTSPKKIEGTLSRCIHLHTLVLDHCSLANRDRSNLFSSVLAPMDKLTYLSAVATNLSYATLCGLSQLQSLKVLKLNSTKVSDRVLLHLKNLTNLTHLDIGSTPLKPTGTWSSTLSQMTSLKNLCLSGLPLENVGSSFLLPLVGLQYLDLSDTLCQLTSEFDQLRELRSLVYVHSSQLRLEYFRQTSFPPLASLTIDRLSFPLFPALPSLDTIKLVDRKKDTVSWDNFTQIVRFYYIKNLILLDFLDTDSLVLHVLKIISRGLPQLECLVMDIYWDDRIGKFDQNFTTLIAKLPTIRNLQHFYLRVFMETLSVQMTDIIWQSLISVLIQQKTSLVLKQIQNCEIALVLKNGCSATGRSLICRYVDRKWATKKRYLNWERVTDEVTLNDNPF
eukprot:TRINITY_DN4336_c0_g1_i22.p1 TRINITY_DN4336_c0_g1~~TRINITY_DN4336_c0_g1_i22.p1  ORF type:complete len:417 (-),score=50.42 TRINITY_DN4336_c0_g1_i22:194-1444(-)